jgi:hypothetical protein
MVLPPAVAMWLPNLFFLGLTIYFVRKVATDTHTAILEKFYDVTHEILRRVSWFARSKK